MGKGKRKHSDNESKQESVDVRMRDWSNKRTKWTYWDQCRSSGELAAALEGKKVETMFFREPKNGRQQKLCSSWKKQQQGHNEAAARVEKDDCGKNGPPAFDTCKTHVLAWSYWTSKAKESGVNTVDGFRHHLAKATTKMWTRPIVDQVIAGMATGRGDNQTAGIDDKNALGERLYLHNGKPSMIPADFQLTRSRLKGACNLWRLGKKDNKTTRPDKTLARAPVRPLKDLDESMLPEPQRSEYRETWVPLFRWLQDQIPEEQLEGETSKEKAESFYKQAATKVKEKLGEEKLTMSWDIHRIHRLTTAGENNSRSLSKTTATAETTVEIRDPAANHKATEKSVGENNSQSLNETTATETWSVEDAAAVQSADADVKAADETTKSPTKSAAAFDRTDAAVEDDPCSGSDGNRWFDNDDSDATALEENYGIRNEERASHKSKKDSKDNNKDATDEDNCEREPGNEQKEATKKKGGTEAIEAERDMVNDEDYEDKSEREPGEEQKEATKKKGNTEAIETERDMVSDDNYEPDFAMEKTGPTVMDGKFMKNMELARMLCTEVEECEPGQTLEALAGGTAAPKEQENPEVDIEWMEKREWAAWLDESEHKTDKCARWVLATMVEAVHAQCKGSGTKLDKKEGAKMMTSILNKVLQRYPNHELMGATTGVTLDLTPGIMSYLPKKCELDLIQGAQMLTSCLHRGTFCIATMPGGSKWTAAFIGT